MHILLLCVLYLVLPTWAMLAAEPGRGPMRRYVQVAAVVVVLAEIMVLPARPVPALFAVMFAVNVGLVVWGHLAGRKSHVPASQLEPTPGLSAPAVSPTPASSPSDEPTRP